MPVNHFVFLKLKVSKGFTLVELLVVMGILSAIVGASILFLTNILKGSNQVGISVEVKQNGQLVFDSIDRQIRNAASVRQLTGPDGSNEIELVQPGGTYLYIACFNKISSTSNGWIGLAVKSSAAPPSSNSEFSSLTNRDLVSGVDVECNAPCPADCSFQVLGNTTDPYPQVVRVSFKMNQAVSAPSRAEFLVNAQYRTTISLRKY